MNEKNIQNINREMNDRINKALMSSPMFRNMFSRNQADYIYLEDKNKNRYFYTTQKIEHKGLLRYVAGIYKYKKTKNQFKLLKKVGFAKKKLAIDWADKEYERSL